MLPSIGAVKRFAYFAGAVFLAGFAIKYVIGLTDKVSGGVVSSTIGKIDNTIAGVLGLGAPAAGTPTVHTTDTGVTYWT